MLFPEVKSLKKNIMKLWLLKHLIIQFIFSISMFSINLRFDIVNNNLLSIIHVNNHWNIIKIFYKRTLIQSFSTKKNIKLFINGKIWVNYQVNKVSISTFQTIASLIFLFLRLSCSARIWSMIKDFGGDLKLIASLKLGLLGIGTLFS